MHKKSWKDKQGLGTWGLVAVIIVIVILVAGLVLAVSYVSALTPYDVPIKDDDKDDPPPIFGYFSPKAEVVLDNKNWVGGARAYFGTIKCDFQSDSSSLSFLEYLGVFATTWDMSVKFTIDGPAAAGYHFVNQVDFEQYVSGGGISYKDITPTSTPGARYHGTYNVIFQLLDADGNQLDSKSISVTV